jgi:hypothetical protein
MYSPGGRTSQPAETLRSRGPFVTVWSNWGKSADRPIAASSSSRWWSALNTRIATGLDRLCGWYGRFPVGAGIYNGADLDTSPPCTRDGTALERLAHGAPEDRRQHDGGLPPRLAGVGSCVGRGRAHPRLLRGDPRAPGVGPFDQDAPESRDCPHRVGLASSCTVGNVPRGTSRSVAASGHTYS